jgi:hypothetical protein
VIGGLQAMQLFKSNEVGMPGAWVKDEDRETCMLCQVDYGLITRRHHCRSVLYLSPIVVLPASGLAPAACFPWFVTAAVHSIESLCIRLCGGLFCAKCSNRRTDLPKFDLKDVRVCALCYGMHGLTAIQGFAVSLLAERWH